MANEAKQFTIGGVTHDVMDVGARQAIASLQNAIDAITSGDTTTAIKTFQEVIDFLDGVTDDATLIGKLNELRTLISAKYSKPSSGIPASDLANGVIPDVSVFATKTEVNAKANSADVVPKSRTVNGKELSSNVTIGMSDIQGLETAIADAGKVKSVSVNGGTAQTPDGNGNVNVSVPTLTFDDAPTAGSNNAVKSGGIKTALDAKANATDVPTKTEMSDAIDDALGEAQVTVVPAGSIGVIDSMGSDSTTDALSANMGKRFKAALLILMGSIGNYAFPNGRPNLPLDGSASVTFNVSYISNPNVSYGSNPPTEVELLGRLEVSISVVSNLYIMDVDNMKVYMGGVPQEDVYNAATGKITINQVVGDVVIVPALMSYVDVDGSDNKLAFMLDCKNGVTRENDTPTMWTDLIGGKEFALTNVDITDAGAVFNGSSSKGVVESGGLDVSWNSATIEIVCSRASASGASPVLINNLNARVLAYFWTAGTNPAAICSFGVNSGNGSTITSPINAAILISDLNIALSASKVRVVKDGVTLSNPYATNYMDYSAAPRQKLSVGYGLNSNDSEMFLNGTIKAIRVYKSQLTEQQQQHNYKIDQKRFNLS